MDAAPLLAAVATLLGAASVWEIAGARGEEVGNASRRALAALSGGRARSIADAALRLGIPDRLTRAGLDRRFGVGSVLAAKLTGAAAGVLVAMLAAPALPGRTSLVAAIAFPAAGFMAPDALLEREARRRLRRIVVALPDALDLLAVGAEAGRSPGAVLGEIAGSTSGPLAAEVAIAMAEIECGASQSDALGAMRDRIHGGEVSALTAALERSGRYGSPLADQLRERATALRHEQRRRVEELAARAAPKIQLVVALALVPSVLLMIVAALVANAELLLGGL